MPSADQEGAIDDAPEPQTLKRKRDDEHDTVTQTPGYTNGDAPNTRVSRAIEDVWILINSHPGAPILKAALEPESATSPISPPTSPTSRPKRSDATSEPLSKIVAEKVKSNSYHSLPDFAREIYGLVAKGTAVIQQNHDSNAEPKKWRYKLDTDEYISQHATLMSLNRYVSDVVERESATIETRQRQRVKLEEAESRPMMNGVLTNGVKEEPQDTSIAGGRQVLTLFGNAQGHKQLYSSFQILSGSQDEFSSTAKSELVETSQVREEGLPIGISSLTIPSIDAAHAPQPPKRRFAEAFGPPPKLQALAPPETPKIPHTRGSVLTWAPIAPLAKTAASGRASSSSGSNAEKLIYPKQQLSTGAWLGYGGVVVASEPTSAEAKRKQRDRALSTGEAGRLSSDAVIAAQLQAKEEALFRSVYSSFAPAFDNSAAVVPESVKNDIWWDRSGKQFYDEVFAIDPALEDYDVADEEITVEDTEMGMNGDADEEHVFKDLIENYEEPSLDPLSLGEAEELGTAAKLEKISELLETIHSHQRIRNSTISSGTHTPISPNPSLQDLRGTPSTPSTAETDVYNDVRLRLADVISSLPPYVVSKLRSDQLEDLIISRNIIMQPTNIKGVLEEDQVSRLAKAAAITAAISTGQATVRTGANQYGPYTRKAQHSNTPVSRHAPSFQRQNLSNWQSPAQSYASTVQRPSYAQGGYGYNPQTPRAPNTAPQMRPSQPLGQYVQQSHQQQQQPRPIQTQHLPNGQYGSGGQAQSYASPQSAAMQVPNMGSPGKPNLQQYSSIYRPPSSSSQGISARPPSSSGLQSANEAPSLSHVQNHSSAPAPMATMQAPTAQMTPLPSPNKAAPQPPEQANAEQPSPVVNGTQHTEAEADTSAMDIDTPSKPLQKEESSDAVPVPDPAA